MLKGKKEVIAFAGLEIHFGLDAAETDNQLSVFKVVINAGAKIPAPHYHLHFDEAIYAVKGITTYTVDGETIHMEPGDSIFIKRGQVHSFTNLHAETAETLCAITPGVFGAQYFRDIAMVINAGGPPDMVKVVEVLNKHGLVPVKQ